jgi:chitin disaccharide deacetylase
MRAIIVNADDLGRTVGINDGIFEAHRRGVVSSATLMVGAPATDHAVRHLEGYPDLGVGLHVTLTGGGEPTLGRARVPSLVGADGAMPRSPAALGAADAEELLAEVRHQVHRFVSLTGRLPTHLDSHHHAHRVPRVLAAMAAVAQEHGLPVRNAAAEVGGELARLGVATTAAFEEEFFAAAATLLHFVEILHSIAKGEHASVEIMCHPGYSDDALRADSSYADYRERELAVLTDREARAAIRELGLRLVHFGALRPQVVSTKLA